MSEQDDIYSAENLSVYDLNGNFLYGLNTRLAERQKLTAEDIELLKLSHIMRDLIFKAMEATDDRDTLRKLAQRFETLEYMQQELWGFEKDKRFHRWFEVPKCSCPKLDNQDWIGSDHDIVSLNCIIHGGKRDETR